jgi:predicted amidohydrolase YtcJ
VKDATDAGLRPSYHNDGSVTPPSPLGNIKTCVTRTTNSGVERGPDQKVTLDQALRAETIDAAFILGREHEIGSIEVGKFADFVQLSVDPYSVDPMDLSDGVSVLGTWLSGEKIDLEAFEKAAGVVDPTPHMHLATIPRKCC